MNLIGPPNSSVGGLLHIPLKSLLYLLLVLLLRAIFPRHSSLFLFHCFCFKYSLRCRFFSHPIYECASHYSSYTISSNAFVWRPSGNPSFLVQFILIFSSIFRRNLISVLLIVHLGFVVVFADSFKFTFLMLIMQSSGNLLLLLN